MSGRRRKALWREFEKENAPSWHWRRFKRAYKASRLGKTSVAPDFPGWKRAA